ncbi:MAG: TlpA family protein disulfide reductase [Flavobacteriaceae bacterium]|nr:TlpA family protein disulfide reductase [Flavobacteriaceae bacterium]MCB0485679.1 TlpA family protein disulfide reductase [Flavobacteriaceae bacterium]
MKNLIYSVVGLLLLVSCEKAPKDYVTLKGKITNPNSDSLVIKGKDDYKKVIKLNADGTFEDTLKLSPNYYSMFDGKEYASLYLKNGFDINLTLDAGQFDETIKFEGSGNEASSFLAMSALFQEGIFENDSLYTLEKDTFMGKMDTYVEKFNKDLESTQNLDSTFIADQQGFINNFKKFVIGNYDDQNYLKTVLVKGAESPKFNNYENFKGGTTSLDDLKGKYVYIDLWATWCAPCKAEIPFLKKVEEEYHDKNIAFVSISLDREKDYETWKKMVAEKELTGIQLYFKGDEEFVDAYKVTGIPRFLLIDPQGNIVTADAPRPSDGKLIELFKSLNI